MRVLVVSGIWPPDVGGPASHAPDVAAYLRSRGHEVEVVTTAAAAPATEEYPVHWISRSLPKGVIHARTAAEIARRARWADVVYTTGMFGRSASGATLARRPYVVKLTADPAFERARRRGMVGGDVDEFQRSGGGRRDPRAPRRPRRRAAARGPRLHAERLPARSSPCPGASRRSASRSCRIRRRRFPSCARATSFEPSSA